MREGGGFSVRDWPGWGSGYWLPAGSDCSHKTYQVRPPFSDLCGNSCTNSCRKKAANMSLCVHGWFSAYLYTLRWPPSAGTSCSRVVHQLSRCQSLPSSPCFHKKDSPSNMALIRRVWVIYMRLLLELKLEDCIFLQCGAFVPNHKQQSVRWEAMRDEILGSKLPKTACA